MVANQAMPVLLVACLSGFNFYLKLIVNIPIRGAALTTDVYSHEYGHDAYLMHV